MAESYTNTAVIDRVQDYLYSLEDWYLRKRIRESPDWANIEQNSEFMRALYSRGTGAILEEDSEGHVLRQDVTQRDKRSIEFYSLLRDYSCNIRKGLTAIICKE
jgi:hypothetical protein